MELVIRATAIYWFLWLVVRGIGKRSLAELSPIDLVLLVVIGDIVQQAVTQEDMSIAGAVLGRRRLRAVDPAGRHAVAAVARRGADARRFPVLRDPRRRGGPRRAPWRPLTIEELHEAVREKGFGDLGGIAYGVLDPDGRFSFIARTPEPSQPDRDRPV